MFTKKTTVLLWDKDRMEYPHQRKRMNYSRLQCAEDSLDVECMDIYLRSWGYRVVKGQTVPHLTNPGEAMPQSQDNAFVHCHWKPVIVQALQPRLSSSEN